MSLKLGNLKIIPWGVVAAGGVTLWKRYSYRPELTLQLAKPVCNPGDPNSLYCLADDNGDGYTYFGIRNPHPFSVEIIEISLFFSAPISFTPIPEDDLFEQITSDVDEFRFRLSSKRQLCVNPDVQKLLAVRTLFPSNIVSRPARIQIVSRARRISWDAVLTRSFERVSTFNVIVRAVTNSRVPPTCRRATGCLQI